LVAKDTISYISLSNLTATAKSFMDAKLYLQKFVSKITSLGKHKETTKAHPEK